MKLPLSPLIWLILVPFFAYIPIIANAQTDENGWILQREGDSIKVYTRNLDGNILDEYKATTVVYNIPIDSIYALLIRDNGRWFSLLDPVVTQYEVLKASDDKWAMGEYYAHVEIKMPIFIKNRDFVVRTNYRKTSRGYIIESQSMPDYIPRQPGFIRIGDGKTYYLLTLRADGGVDVALVGRLDLGGDIPDRVINKSLVSSVYDRLDFIKNKINEIIGKHVPE